jgi:long-chain fatty acid transport protein
MLFSLNGGSEIGYGAKSKGMGGVGIALPQEAMVIAHNPAGISRLATRFDIGLGYVAQSNATESITLSTMSVRSSLSGRSSIGPLLPEVGLVWSLNRLHTIGVAAYCAGGITNRFPRDIYDNQLTPQTQFDYRAYFFSPTWSISLPSGQSFGVSINIIYQTLYDNLLASADSTLYPNNAGNTAIDWAPAGSVAIGYLGRFPCGLKLGISYFSHLWSGRFTRYRGIFPNAGELFWPSRIGAGISWSFRRCWMLAFDYNYLFWKDSRGFKNAEFVQSGLLGSVDAPSFGWLNQPICKVGLSYRLCRWVTVRAGYNFGNNPIPPSQTFRNKFTLSLVEHHLTLGGTIRLCKGQFSVYYYHGFKNHLTNLNPDFPGSTQGDRQSSEQNGMGLAYGARF